LQLPKTFKTNLDGGSGGRLDIFKRIISSRWAVLVAYLKKNIRIQGIPNTGAYLNRIRTHLNPTIHGTSAPMPGCKHPNFSIMSLSNDACDADGEPSVNFEFQTPQIVSCVEFEASSNDF